MRYAVFYRQAGRDVVDVAVFSDEYDADKYSSSVLVGAMTFMPKKFRVVRFGDIVAGGFALLTDDGRVKASVVRYNASDELMLKLLNRLFNSGRKVSVRWIPGGGDDD